MSVYAQYRTPVPSFAVPDLTAQSMTANTASHFVGGSTGSPSSPMSQSSLKKAASRQLTNSARYSCLKTSGCSLRRISSSSSGGQNGLSDVGAWWNLKPSAGSLQICQKKLSGSSPKGVEKNHASPCVVSSVGRMDLRQISAMPFFANAVSSPTTR